jgi:hypothetical protein
MEVRARRLLDLPEVYHTAPWALAWQGRCRAWMLRQGCRAVGRCHAKRWHFGSAGVRSTMASRHQEAITLGTDRHAAARRGASTRRIRR